MARYDNILTGGDELLAEAFADDDVAGRVGATTATLTLIFDLVSDDRDEANKTSLVDVATVTISRTELLKLGAETPHRDMAILPATYDADDGWYAWSGDILAASATHFVLKFERPRPYRLGRR